MRWESKSPGQKVAGFSLVELVVVLSIVLVLLSLALPPLLRARDAANQAAAAGALHTITVGQTTYFSLYHGYAPSLAALGPPRNGQAASASAADLIDAQLASGYRNGYFFRYVVVRRDDNGAVIEYMVTAEQAGSGLGVRLSANQSGPLGGHDRHRDEGESAKVGESPK